MVAKNFKVALLQTHPKPLDPAYNFDKAQEWLEDAAKQGASLAVLPEYHLTGWQPDESDFATCAASASEWIAKYQTLARTLHINIVPGTIVTTKPLSANEHDHGDARPFREKPPLYNIAMFIDEEGQILGDYIKSNLWHPERQHLTSGPAYRDSIGSQESSHCVFDTSLGRIGLLVCYDLFWPEAFRACVAQGARIIIVPTFTKADDMSAEGLALNPDGEALFIKSAVVTRAFENTCCIIFCNVGGPSEDGFVGLSQVALPVVGSLGCLTADPAMSIVEVDTTIIDVAEANYKIRQDLRDGTHRV